MPDNVDKLFEIMQAKGAASDRDKFRKVFLTPGNKGYKIRKDIYDGLRADGIIDSPTYEDFRRKLRLGGTPTVNKYRQQMFNSVDPNKSRASELTHRAVGQAVRATNNVRKPVTAKVLNRKGKPTGNEFAITPAKTVEDLDREYAQETTKNWENELHDQMADADRDAAKISDMFKSFIGSTDEVGSVWGNMTRGGGIAGTPHSVTTNNGILENTEARQILAAGDYNRKRRELLQLEKDSRNGAIFDNHSFFRGMYDAAKDTGFLTGGASDLINAGSLLATKQDLDNGVHTEAGDMLMQQAVKNSDAQSQYGDNQGWMYTGGVITTNMAPFMVQIGSAGFSKGMSNAIGKVVQGAASKVALGTMEKATGIAGAHIANYIGKVTGLTTKAFGKAIQYGIVGAAQANTVGLGNVTNDVINRYTGQVYQDEQGNYKFGTFDSDGKLVHEGGEDFLTALVKGEAAQTIEFATELAGGGIDAAGTALKNFVTKGGKKIINKYNMENVSKVIDFLLNNKVSKNARYLKAGVDRTLGKVEVNSIVGESLEEELGIIANTVFTGDNKISDLWDEKQQSQIWGGMLLSIGLMKGAVAPFHAYNAKQYYSYKHKLDKADVNLPQLLGKENWEKLRNQIDATTNEDMPEMVNKINRDVALGKNRQPVREYIQNLLIMRGYDIGNMLAAKKAVEDKGEGVSVKNMEKNQAYQQGRDAYGYDTHEIQLDQEDKQKSLAQLLGISEQQLASMSDEELEALSGRDDNIDRAIYDYQLSTARYEGVIDNARDQIDLEVQRAAQAVDMYTDKSRNTIRNATIKATGGLEDYGVYIINGNIATHEDGSIDISNSDDMILYYDPTTNTVEHADAMMFAELGSEENADEVRSQAMADAKEKAIKETTGIIDGVVEVGTQFKTVDADGTEHTYEVLADNGDGTAMITIDGNIPTELVNGENVNIPVSFEELQKMKDESDQQRLQAAKAEREQMEKERAAQQTQETEQTQPSFDFNQILNDDGNVVLVDVLDKDGNTKYPDSKLFLIRDAGAKAKVVELKSDGTIVPHAVNKEDVATISSMSLDEYKQAMPESSMIEENSGENRGEIEVETPTIEGEVAAPDNEVAAPESAETPATSAITLEDGTIVPMLEDGNPDFSKLTAEQTAELYDTQFGEDADSIVSGYVSDAKKALDKASNMTVKGKTFVEQKAAKQAKEKAIADAQAAYDSAVAIRDAYNERQLAKVEDTAEGRKELIEKARRKFARLKSAVKDDAEAEAVAQIYKETVGTLLHRLYDGTGIDVTDTIPLTAEEYVASNLGAHSLNYEGTETSKGVKQETGLSREDFAKTQLLAADGKGTTIDNLVHSLWENRPSNLDSLDTQDIRNAMLSIITSGFKASEARNYIENLRIAQAENILEEQKKAADNAAFAEENKAESEQQTETAPESEVKTGEENSDEYNDEENEKINEQTNENINAPEVPEDATEENPLGLQLSEDKVPFEIEGGKSGETYNINDNEDRQRLINDNKVDDKDILDIDMPKHVHKAIKELCKKMGLKVQFLYMGARSNGWIENGTMYLALDTEKATQFVFGHEMTHAIKQKNPEAYKELVKVAMAVTTKKKFEEDLEKVYQNYHGISGYNNVDDYVEEVVADNLGKFINNFDLAQKFSLRLNHPVLATILHAIQKIKSLLYGDFYKSVDALERIVEKAYVDTAKGEITNSETGEDVSFSLRQKPEPKKKGIGYKVFVLKDGKLYPPMVANPDGAATPVGVWLDADAAPIAGESKTGRPQVKQGGKGTQGGSGKLAYRPGWHLGVVPYAIQFNRKDAEGNKTLFPKNFVFAEVEYAADVDYQEEARQEGINPSGKYQHSLAGLKHLPTDGYYMYRTNPNPETDPWVITGAMKVNRILTRAEQAELVKNAGREPQQIQEGDIVTDDVVNSINQEIADAPKFSLKDINPVGKNQFGYVYDQFKGKPKEAFDFLLENKDGYLKGVFHRDEIGDIDLAYGSAPNPYKGKGLAHIIRKHVETLHDFPSVDDAINTITDVISNGIVKDGSIPNTYDIENGDYRVVVAADKNGNWVLTAFDYVNPTKKKKKGTATALPPSQSSDGAGAVAPNLSAAKIDNSSETTKENGEKFSLKDEKTLAGVHNITEEKLRKALKLGGFANPSLAVIDTNKSGHNNFGEISFIAPSALLDKRTGNTGGTWITDAYTQRYPSVEREMSEKGYRKFEDWVDSLDYPSGAKAEIERQAKDALSDNNAPAWELMYLKEKGIDIKEYDSRIDYRWKEVISDHPTAEDILNSMKTDPELNEKVTSLAKHAIIHPTWEKVSLEVRRKMYKETGVKASPINPQVRKQTKEIFERDYAPSLLNKNGTPKKSDVKKVVEQMVKEHNDTKKYDFYLSKVKASNYVNKNGLYDDYIRWQENKLDEFGTKNRIFRGYTRDGSRKYVPETLENVSKVMREEADGQTNGSEYTSFGSFIAKLASRVDSTDEMRANKDKLSSNKDKEEFYEKWNEVYYDLAKFLYNDVFYGEQRLHDIVLQADPKKYAKKEYGITLTPTFMKKLDALKNAVQTELKSAYFETKYNRPLRLNEFAAAVVPDNLGEDVRKGIENAGLPMYDYDPKKDGDRSRAFNEAINSSDNIRFSLAGERGAAAADKAEERTARMDNLSVARKMEEEKKDAKAIKMATGWERGADGKWRYEMPDAKIKDTMDVGGGHIVKRYEDDMLWNGGKLSKMIDAPELFKAYPQLKDVRIDTDAIMNDMPSNGEYNSKTNTITIHADELKYMNSILNHEIQHVIQDIEGFAKGGSPGLVRGEVKKKLNELTKQIRQLRAEGKEDEAKALIEKNRGLYNAYQKNDDYNSYKSLAGEVEARNVSARLNMTPEERRKSLAESTEDVARKDQIFLGVGDVSFSLRDMADGKESGAADMAEDLKSLNTPDEVDDAIKTAIEDMPSGWKMANKKMIHVAQALGENRKAEIAGEEPKFSLKDGTLIKAGTYFSGGGLVEEGLKGIIDPVVAVEYDEKISGVYRNNFGQHIVTADVRDVDPRELVKQIDGEVEYFHASPVCKNYSQAKSNHTEVELDKETAASTAEFINAVKPKVVTIENVKGYKDSEAMKIITDALDANGYTWDADVYNAADYGGYTNRERLIVRAVRDGKLPAKPKKMAHKSGWYEAVEDIIPTLTGKKNGVANWMDIRLKADGIDWRNIDNPLYVMGSAYADGKVPHAFADELLPTLRTKSGDVIVMPDGKVYRAMGRVLARVSGVSDDYKMPFSENLSHTIIGNGIPTQLTEHVIAPLLQNTLRPTTPEDGNTKFSLRYDQFEHDLNQWKKDNNLPKDAQRPTIPQRNAGESAVDFLRRVDEYRKQMALWATAPTYEQHLLSDDTALGEFNRELQRGSVLKRIAFQDSMLAIRKAQEAIMKEVGVDRLNMAEDAYTAENRSHGKGKNEFEEYNNEFLQPLRKAYHQMKKILGDSYDNVRIYMMAKHGLERDAQMAFKKSLEADFEDVAQRSAAYRAYKGDMNRITNDSDLEFGRVDFNTWRQRDNALRTKYSPSYMDYRYDKNGIAYDYSGLSALFGGSDFEEAAHKLVRDIESSHVAEVQDLWNATNAATKKILRDGYKAGMMSKDTYLYVRDMYSHYIPLRGWDGTTADQVWDYVGGGKGAFNQTLKTAHGRTSIADDPIAYIENMAESGILLNNKNWVKQHLMLLAQNHPTSLLTLSKAWYVKSTDANGNEEWIPATPQITSQMNSNQVKAAIDSFEQKMEQMAQTGDATQQRDGLNIAYPQTHSEEREHEVRVMKDGEEYVIYVNGDPQLAQAMNNTRAHRVSEGIKNSISKRVIAVVGRKMAAAYTSLSPLFIPSNYFRDLTMTLASTAIREDGRYNYLLRKNLATSWNLGFMLKDYQNGKLREKVSNGNATPKEQMFYDFMMNGGETGFVSSLDVEDLKKKFKNDLKDLDRWKANPVKVGHTIMDSIEFLNRMIEDSNRFAVYMTSIQYGRSIDEAVNDAKDVTLNFNRKGTGEHSWQTIRNLYLFINPAVQSLQTLGTLAKHHPFKFTAVTASWIASGVLVPIVNAALMQMAAAFLGGDGDDDKDWYKDISKKYWQFSKWDRRNNFIMWVPTTHEFVKIPLAQEFRAFYGLGDMIASKMMGGELAEESWEDYGWDLVGQVVDMLPLDPTGYDGELGVSLMPNPIRPVFELAFNVDFTGKPLFKDTEYNKYDPNFTKAYVGTPDWLVRVSRMMNSIGNDYPDVQQNSIDAFGDPRYNLNNPAVVDHVLSSYLGGAYTMGSQVLGVLTKSLNDPKEIKVADIPLFSKFVSNPDDRPVTKKQGDEFWDMKENHDRAANTLSKLKKQAKVDGDYSMLERFYGSEEYKQYKQDDVKVKKYEEDKKKERAEESGEEYRPHKLNAEDIYKAHATPKDDFEDLKLKQLYTKLNGFKSAYDLLVDTAPSQSDGYYNTNKAAIDAIDEISLDKQEISELKKGFLDDGKDAYNAEDMKQIRELRKKILAVLEKANKVVVANQKAKAEK